MKKQLQNARAWVLLGILANLAFVSIGACGYSKREPLPPAGRGSSKQDSAATPTGSQEPEAPSPLPPLPPEDSDSPPAEPGEPGPVCDSTQAPFGGGNGTPQDPYLICSQAQLANVARHSELSFRLATSLELKGDFKPIDSFLGTFDGAGFAISKIRVVNPETDGAGFIIRLEEYAEIKDVIFTDLFVAADNRRPVGGIAAFNLGKITRCAVNGKNSRIIGNVAVGGLVGRNLGGVISDSSSQAKVHVPERANRLTEAGGLVGHLEGGAIYSSKAEGTVRGNRRVGGLVGALISSGGRERTSLIVQGRASAQVTGTSQVGGLVGYCGTDTMDPEAPSQNPAVVENSSADGNVVGGSRVGGLVGHLAAPGVIRNSTASGSVTAQKLKEAGPLVGVNFQGKIENSTGTGKVQASNP
ncbi:MAG: GLUG motif-containing protein [Bacteriovoracia bacterium]